MPRPAPGDYAEFYAGYIELVQGDDVLDEMVDQYEDMLYLLQRVSESDSMKKHAPYT